MSSTVLVVDDQPLNRIIIGKLLRSLNLDVIEASDGHEGLQTYLRYGRSIAFVFLDLVMPVLDGFNAALSIRSAESKRGWSEVPIVAYTSEDVRHGTAMFHRCMQSGFNDVVPKPVNRRHAVELLSRWLPGLKPGSPRGSDASSDDEVRCSCSTAGCSKCTQAGNGTAASTTSAQQGISSGSGSGASAQAGGDDAGSTAGGAGGSSASSVRRWPPGWQG